MPTDTPDGGAPPLADTRRTYVRGVLLDDMLDADPIRQFAAWYEDAWAARETDEPHAMTLCTADADGAPSGRTVLLKGFDERGFSWFTNYGSRKGRELAANPRAALVFRWATLERQVILIGTVTRVAPHESDEYFASRPLGSRIGAAASAQSEVIPDREVLERAAADLLATFGEAGPPRPEHWGGFRLLPATFEFWQGRPDRLHDRFRYRPHPSEGGWVRERLSP